MYKRINGIQHIGVASPDHAASWNGIASFGYGRGALQWRGRSPAHDHLHQESGHQQTRGYDTESTWRMRNGSRISRFVQGNACSHSVWAWRLGDFYHAGEIARCEESLRVVQSEWCRCGWRDSKVALRWRYIFCSRPERFALPSDLPGANGI